MKVMKILLFHSSIGFFALAFGLSLCLHTIALFYLPPLHLTLDEDLEGFQKFDLIEKKTPEMPKEAPVPELKQVVPPKPSFEVEKRKENPRPKPKTVQGFSLGSLTRGGKGIEVPLGNTLLAPDEGKRLRPEELDDLERDLSAPAQLLRTSIVTPEYTREAVDAELEGLFIVDVFVDEKGNVVEAELPTRIGHGMDERLLQAARKASFQPRKNRVGLPISGWTKLTFRLEIR